MNPAERRSLTLGIVALAALPLIAWTVPASPNSCRLALAIGMDVSGSVDEREWRLQRDGLAAALVSPDVVSGFLDGGGYATIAVYEWANHQSVIVPWTVIASEADLHRAANRVRNLPRDPTAGSQTGLGDAMLFGAVMLSEQPCAELVLDISGDEGSNIGLHPHAVHRHPLVEWNITINALPIGPTWVATIYDEQVRYGARSFTEPAVDFADFHRAMVRKLQREIMG